MMRPDCSLRTHASLRAAFALMLFASLSSASAFSQATPAAMEGPPASRLEVFAGASYFHPFNSDLNLFPYQTIDYGAVGSVTGYFNRYLGLQLEGSAFPAGPQDNNCVYTAQAGPVMRLPKGRFVPFIHVLGGAAKVGGPANQPCLAWGWGVTGGAGIDFIVPGLHNHLAIRPIQGDFTYSDVDNGKYNSVTQTGGEGEINAYRLSGGLVFRLGDMHSGAAVSNTLACSATPEEVYPGDPVTLSATGILLSPKKQPEFLWSSPTLQIKGTEGSVTVETGTLQPGTYSATAKLVRGKKMIQVASCMTSFIVRDTEPPVISCATDRAAINSGDPVVVTATARSPQNLGLTYSYTTSNGLITGSGSTAALSTAGTTPGAISITCKVVDAKGKEASATASVVVATPPPPPPAATSRSLCSVAFDRDRKRPNRVDNEAKGCLDDIALTLNRDPGAKLLIVGNHDAKESAQDAGARALNVSEYLIKEKGIDASRLDLREGDTPGRTVSNTLVPAGATLDPGTAASFDGASIHRRGQPYGKPGATPAIHRKHRRKKPAAAPAQ